MVDGDECGRGRPQGLRRGDVNSDGADLGRTRCVKSRSTPAAMPKAWIAAGVRKL
jgi:hypothetical protein